MPFLSEMGSFRPFSSFRDTATKDNAQIFEPLWKNYVHFLSGSKLNKKFFPNKGLVLSRIPKYNLDLGLGQKSLMRT